MMLIGLTGGIGSGKTTVAHLFQKLKVKTLDSDQIARELVEPKRSAYQAIVDHFGTSILKKDNTLDRATLRTLIFESPEERRWLETLLHPLIKMEIQKKVQPWHSEPYIIVEIPLLFESHFEDAVDRILVVDASPQDQIERIMRRDQLSKEAIQAIMNSQISRPQRLAKAQDILVNDGDLAELEDKVLALHQYYNELSNQ